MDQQPNDSELQDFVTPTKSPSSDTQCPECSAIVEDARCERCGAARIAGGYKIERVLVRTQQGRLYLARKDGGEAVALKELVFVKAPTMTAIGAFEREAQFLRTLSHPCIPRFIESFREGGGAGMRFYIAQEHIEGESLDAALQCHRFTEDEVVEIATSVLSILIYLQDLAPPVFHRDIKPTNLIRRRGRTIALVNFGAARDRGSTTMTGAGTFGYMAPEQLAGVTNKTSDVYALGMSMKKLLFRTDPWTWTEDRAQPIVSDRLRGALDKMTMARHEKRHPDARAALDALRAPKRRLDPSLLGYGAAVVAGVVLLTIALAFAWRALDRPREVAVLPVVALYQPVVFARAFWEHSYPEPPPNPPRRHSEEQLERKRAAVDPGIAHTGLKIPAGAIFQSAKTFGLAPIQRAITLEAWFKLDADEHHSERAERSSARIVALRSAFGMSIEVNNGRLGCTTQQSVASDATVPAGEWHHAACAMYPDEEELRLYLDGVFVGSTRAHWAGNAYHESPSVIAGFEGWEKKARAVPDTSIGRTIWVDEVRLWHRARPQQEIAADMANEIAGDAPGLVAYWRFNEGRGQATHDATGFGADGWLGRSPALDALEPSWDEGAPIAAFSERR